MSTSPPATTRPRSRAERLRFAAVLGLPSPLWQAAFFVVPLGFLVAMTFWSVKSFRLQPDFTMANWIAIMKAGFFHNAFIYTLWLSLLAAALASVIAFPAAYTMAFRLKPHMRRLLVFMLVVPFFTSLPVRIYSMQVFFSPQGIINYVIAPLGLGPVQVLNTTTGTLIGFLTLTLPLVVLLQTFALSSIDMRLVEAAHNLRCGRLRTVFTVIIPSARVGLVLAAALAFVLCFGDYISPQFLGGSKPPTLSILIADQVKSGNHWPRASVVAVSMIVTLTVVLGVLLRIAYGGRKA
ncbi:ABC transporter permease [Terrihabitans rhizophilus]|jgi:ABC-type spermidine/putrescine transport system permease subunit I|uniref:ABC transporter permease n=1 Tax=Terrihabitans rhizophilus TaxID=3092662 RepID=A0ABU4RJX5_9HYPH|nr:ABC transporter permease [Terrihabitans sp. PJ23]MDX6804866.1 ABC transporter permease [Terrihabitans sp. PJ23]